jgi:hypothetical protein
MTRFVVGCSWLGLLAAVVGCQPNEPQRAEQIQQQVVAEETKTENLREAMRFADEFSRFNRDQAEKEIGYQLNTWMAADANEVSKTQLPNLVQTLPKEFREMPSLQRVDSREFTATDVVHLIQSRLFKTVSKWCGDTKVTDPLWTAWLDNPQNQGGDGLSDAGKLELQMAYKLFDWTIRNVQLEGEPQEVQLLVKDPRFPLTDEGKGYRQQPWQTMVYGRGDFIERGRVFSELARERNILTVWLGLGSGDNSSPVKLWLMGVPVGDEIFLFDSRLGIPVPGPNQKGIATLRQASSDESILRRLNVVGLFKYPLESKDIKNVVALIDADSAAITGRMKRLQESLTSDQRTELWLDVDAIAERLKKIPGLSAVQYWTMPLLAQVYAEELEKRLLEPNEFSARYMQRFAMYLNDTPLISAKYKHLQGEWSNDDEKQGAMALYMACRVPEEDLEKLPYETELQKLLGIVRMPNEPLERFEARLNQVIGFYREAKIDSTYLIGLLQYDKANYESSLTWLQKRAGGLAGFQRWQSGLWYNTARALESSGKIPEAIELLKKSPSPQEAGNRIRARLLQKLSGDNESDASP